MNLWYFCVSSLKNLSIYNLYYIIKLPKISGGGIKMKQIRYLIAVVLILSLLLGALPASALADALQELMIEEVSQEAIPAEAEGNLPEETAADEAPMQEILLMEEETAEPQPNLSDLPQLMEDVQAIISETVSGEAPIETESAPVGMSIAPLLIEEAQPVSLDALEYIAGEEAADLALNLPMEALPVTEIEGLISDADYFHAEGVLTIASAWLQAQEAEEITLTIHGADGSTYLQPIRFVRDDAGENGEYDPINLLINGAVVAGNSGEGWKYDYAANTLYLNNFSAETIVLMDEMEAFTLHLSGENHVQGIYLGGVKQAAIAGSGSLNITDGHYAIETGSLEIGADVALNVHTRSEAFRLSGVCTLNGQEIDVSGCNEIRIEGGALLRAENVQGLAIGETFLSAEELQNDASGSGWQWIAAEQKLLLNDSSAGTIVSTLKIVRVYAGESMDKLAISARDLVLSGEEGVWITDVQLDAASLELASGTWILAEGAEEALTLENLSASGGSLRTDADVAAEKLVISGGSLKVGTLTTNDLKLSGGSLNVTDSMLYYEDETGKTYYGLVAVNAEMSGGSLLTAEPAFFGNYKQTGGTAEFAINAQNPGKKHLLAVGASETFTATGGALYAHNGYSAAIFATEINLGGTLTADIYGEGGVLLAEKITVADKKITSLANTTLVMSKGKRKTLKAEEYAGLVFGTEKYEGSFNPKASYSEHMFETMSFSGSGWDWDHEKRLLTIYSTSDYSRFEIYSDQEVTVHLYGGRSNYYLQVYSTGPLTVTGDGKVQSGQFYSAKALKVKNGCANLDAKLLSEKSITASDVNMEKTVFETTGSVNIKNSEYEGIVVRANGNVNITNSIINSCDITSNKGLTAKNSYIAYDQWNTVYLKGKASFKNCLVLNQADKYTAKGGTSYSSDTAMFIYDWKKGQFNLQRSATISGDCVLRALDNGSKFNIPSGKSITIQKGATLWLDNSAALEPASRIKGSGKVERVGSPAKLPDPVQLIVTTPNEIPLGSKVQLIVVDENGANRSDSVSWSFDSGDLNLLEKLADNWIRVRNDASKIGQTVTLTFYHSALGYQDFKFTITASAEEISARDASGRYAKNIELSLDPANKTAQLTAKIYPKAAQQAVTWKSSDSKIVSVDANGVITAKKAGSANVYAIAADGSGVQSQNVKVTVKKAPTSIKFTTAKPVLGYDPENGTGSAYQLKVKLSSGSASTVKYTSANEGIAVVDANGVVTAKGAGKVKITAQTYNGKKATCTVEVKTAPKSITISPKELTIGVGMKHSFAASIPKGSFGSWYFSTSNACGSIDASTGEFVALKPGEVDVIVTSFNGRSDSCTVQVLPAPEVLQLNRPQLKMGLNEKFTLDVEASLKDGSPAMGSYTYTSSDKKVATVSSSGRITAKKRGTAIITVTANGGATAQCEVTVEKAPSKVSLKAKKVTLVYDADARTGTEFMNPASLPSGTSSTLTYKSSTPKVAEMDGEGRITARGVGTAKITVKTYNGKSATCTVTVKAAPKELKFDQESYTISVGQEFYAKITNASGMDLTRYGEIASLSPAAELLAADAQGAGFAGREVGAAQLKAAAFNGAEGYAEVRVLPPPDALALEKTTLTLKKGKKYTVKALLSREDGQETTAGLSLVSGNTKIAGVSGMTITAKAKGKTVITVQTHNGLSQEIQLKVN